MKAVSKRSKLLCLCGMLTVLAICGVGYCGGPLKVFILAGQSNMEGKGAIDPVETQGTLSYIAANDPANYGHLKDGGDWAVRSDVWMYYQRINAGSGAPNGAPLQSGLTVGYGSNDGQVGPELQFGNIMGDFYGEPVFIIKVATGGKSLGGDYLPPSSGWTKIPEVNGDRGYYYKMILDTVDSFKADPASFCSVYDPNDGYEIVGFGWHQGWNDRVTSAFSAAYEVNMANFIRDIRADLGIPDLPFCIATTAMGSGEPSTEVEFAQLAMADYAKYPDFEGDVASDDTRPYWRPAEESPSGQGYHWNNNALTYCLIGEGLAEGLKELIVDPNAPIVDAGADMITWSGEPVIMNPEVTEREGSDWTNLTYSWTATPAAGVTFSPSPNVINPAVTITGATTNPSTVVIKLEVNNSGRATHGVIDTMQIDIYDTACKAALAKGLASSNLTDIDGDCVTTLADFAVLSLEWLKEEKLYAPIKK